MSIATLNVKVLPRRMLTMREASTYCGVPEKQIQSTCPFAPIAMPNKKLLYDIKDLDLWLDGMKNSAPDGLDAILGRLGK